jgi:AcrR family transcriptional regulator
MSAEVEGLRQRKKQRTRDLIIRSALDLFLERGFARTTVSEIAEAADISPSTFFAYFPSKEDVVFHDQARLMAELAERLSHRAPAENAFDALRVWVLELDEATGGLDREEERARRRLIRDTPALAARDRANFGQLEALLAEAVAADLGVGFDSLRPHLVSAAAVAALDALGRRRDVEEDIAGSSAAEVLDEALVFLQGGLDALRRNPEA